MEHDSIANRPDLNSKGDKDMYPIILKPVLKDYIWGGSKLIAEYGKVSDLERVAESWELSCHDMECSIIKKGEYKHLTLNEYIQKVGKGVLGSKAEKYSDFPILIKLIDANDNLSLQVHPDDTYALKYEGEYGKNEMWYIVDCSPGASIIVGLKSEVSKEEFKKRIDDNTLLDICEQIPVNIGDTFYIEAGTIHAIGRGILIAEVQQNSNITYRVYDYDRTDKNGNKRELHIEKAIDVLKLHPQKVEVSHFEKIDTNGNISRDLLKCKYFIVREMVIKDEEVLMCGYESFQSILILEGTICLKYKESDMKLTKGDSVFIPANIGMYTIKGQCKLLLTELS